MPDPHTAAQLWVHRYADRVFRLAYALTGERTRAEDAAQESLYHIARWVMGHPDFEPSDAWIYQVTRNAVRDLVRGLPPPTVSWDETHLGETSEEQRVERLDVQWALNQLPTADREVLVLAYYLDLSGRDVAQVLNISETAVRIRLSRARKKFRAIFEGTPRHHLSSAALGVRR